MLDWSCFPVKTQQDLYIVVCNDHKLYYDVCYTSSLIWWSRQLKFMVT